MVLSLNDSWRLEIIRGSAKPIFLVDLQLGPTTYIDVIDFSVGGGEDLTITTNLGAHTVQEGSDFDSEIDEATTAQNICDFVNEDVTLSAEVYAAQRDGRITVVPKTTGVTSIAITSSNEAAWTTTTAPRPLPGSIKFVSGDKPFLTYPNILASVGSVASSKDLETGAASIGDVELTFVDDGVLRDFMVRARPKGRKVTLKLGAHTLDEGNFVSVGTYVIDDYRPDYGCITIDCAEPFSQLVDAKVSGNFVQMHPLACIRRILDLAGVDAQFIDDDSLESTDARYDEISHWAITRSEQADSNNIIHGNISGPVNGVIDSEAKDLIDQLCLLLDGSMRALEDGTYSFVRHDPDAAVVRQLGENEITDVEVLSNFDPFYNAVTVSGIPGTFSEERSAMVLEHDTVSQVMAGVTGLSSSFDLSLETDWIGRWGYVVECPDASGLQFGINGTALGPFSGSRQDDEWVVQGTPPAQRAEDELSSTRLATLMIFDGDGYYEYVECDSVTWITSVPGGSLDYWLYDQPVGLVGWTEPTPGVGISSGMPSQAFHAFTRYNVRTGGRGVRGSTAQNWELIQASHFGDPDYTRSIKVIDITIAREMAERKLSRFSNGCPQIKFRTSLANYDLQLGDFLNVSHPLYLAFNKDGSDTTIVWEIISKELQVLDDSPGITWTCARVRDDDALEVIGGYSPPVIVVDPGPPDEPITDNAGAIVTDDSFETLYP